MDESDTILHVHIKFLRPSTEFLEKIHKKNPSLISKCNTNGDTPLHVAAEYGHSTIVDVILRISDRKILTMGNEGKNTALHKAVQYGKTEVVEILIRADPDFSYFPINSGETPLYLAASSGNYEMVVAMLGSCQSMAHRGPHGRTALHAAVKSADEASIHIMRELVEKKPSLTKEADNYRWTPLHYAAYHGHSEKVDLLLNSDRSAARAIGKDRKITALHMAASQGHKVIIEKICSECRECRAIKDSKGWNFLHFAMLSSSKEELNDLLSNLSVVESDITSGNDEDGNTPFHIFAAAYHEDSFSVIENCQAVNIESLQALNNEFLTVEDILEDGYPNLEREIKNLFKKFNHALYPNGLISKRQWELHHTGEKHRVKRSKALKEARAAHLILAGLIATATFTAAFTIPGGYKQNTPDIGTAVLNKKLAFQIFIIINTMAMAPSFFAVFVYLILSFEKFQKFGDLFAIASCLTVFALLAQVLSFVTGTMAVLGHSSRLATTVCFIGVIFFLLTLYALYVMWRQLAKFMQRWKRRRQAIMHRSSA